MWCDASSITMGVVLEIGSNMVEDVTFLRKKDNCNHINVKGMDVVLNGMNLTLR